MAASRATVPDVFHRMADGLVEAVEAAQGGYSSGWYKKWLAFCGTVIGIRNQLDRLRQDSVDVPAGLAEAVKLLEQQRLSSSPWKNHGDEWEAESRRAVAMLASFRPKRIRRKGFPPLKPADVLILEALDKAHPATMTQEGIEDAIPLNNRRGLRTIQRRLDYLRGKKLVCRPLGDKGGEAVTALGSEALQAHRGVVT